MEIVSFGPSSGRHVDRFGSDFVLAPLIGSADSARTVCLHLGPGGVVGEHEAASDQLFCVVSGRGWVSGGDGERHDIGALQAASWVQGERHAAATDTGMVAMVLEGGFSVEAPLVTGS